MNILQRVIVLISVLILGACALPRHNAYDEWRSFYSQVDKMSPRERNAQFVNVRTRHKESPSAITRLQLAYLTLLSPTPETGSYGAESTAALLGGIPDDHELVPVRDLLSRSLQLRKNQSSATAELKKLRQQCEVVADSREALQREHGALQNEVAVCADQVEALKEIESVMSAPEPSTPRLP